ncbi:hypothetical protein K2Q02_01070 [Patescibacteria group bacterium]|nr:hypothetical protein [Patescibacteria group bacterium]
MFQKRLASISLLIIVLMITLNTLATMFYWYVSIPWYDMMMHTLGGVFLVVFIAALFTRRVLRSSHVHSITTVLFVVLIIGLGWEFYEYIVQYSIKGSARLASIPDSISDMVCDMFGGILGVYFVLMLKRRYNKNND